MDKSVLLFATVGRCVILFASMGSTTMGSRMLFCALMGSTTMGRSMLFCASMARLDHNGQINVILCLNGLDHNGQMDVILYCFVLPPWVVQCYILCIKGIHRCCSCFRMHYVCRSQNHISRRVTDNVIDKVIYR
jgi:hypothetical protein